MKSLRGSGGAVHRKHEKEDGEVGGASAGWGFAEREWCVSLNLAHALLQSQTGVKNARVLGSASGS